MMRPRSSISAATLAIFLSAFTEAEVPAALVADNGVFPTFATYIAKQVGIDKEAFAKASACLSWFYKGSKKSPPSAVQGIAWHDDDAGRQEADVVGGLCDLGIGRTLEQIAEKNQPEQHRLDKREQHAEFFAAQPADPPHGQGADFLPILLHSVHPP